MDTIITEFKRLTLGPVKKTIYGVEGWGGREDVHEQYRGGLYTKIGFFLFQLNFVFGYVCAGCSGEGKALCFFMIQLFGGVFPPTSFVHHTRKSRIAWQIFKLKQKLTGSYDKKKKKKSLKFLQFFFANKKLK
jgi:hypothetical protein